MHTQEQNRITVLIIWTTPFSILFPSFLPLLGMGDLFDGQDTVDGIRVECLLLVATCKDHACTHELDIVRLHILTDRIRGLFAEPPPLVIRSSAMLCKHVLHNVSEGLGTDQRLGVVLLQVSNGAQGHCSWPPSMRSLLYPSRVARPASRLGGELLACLFAPCSGSMLVPMRFGLFLDTNHDEKRREWKRRRREDT